MPEQPKDSLEIYSDCVCSYNLHFGKKDFFFKCNWVKNYMLSYIRRSNQPILKDINPEYSVGGLTLKLQ